MTVVFGYWHLGALTTKEIVPILVVTKALESSDLVWYRLKSYRPCPQGLQSVTIRSHSSYLDGDQHTAIHSTMLKSNYVLWYHWGQCEHVQQSQLEGKSTMPLHCLLFKQVDFFSSSASSDIILSLTRTTSKSLGLSKHKRKGKSRHVHNWTAASQSTIPHFGHNKVHWFESLESTAVVLSVQEWAKLD